MTPILYGFVKKLLLTYLCKIFIKPHRVLNIVSGKFVRLFMFPHMTKPSEFISVLCKKSIKLELVTS